MTAETLKAAAEIVVCGAVVWQRIEAGRIKKTAEVAKEKVDVVEKTAQQAKAQAGHAQAQAKKVDDDVNQIDLSKGDRARSIEKFKDLEDRMSGTEGQAERISELERRIGLLDDAIVVLLGDSKTIRRAG